MIQRYRIHAKADGAYLESHGRGDLVRYDDHLDAMQEQLHKLDKVDDELILVREQLVGIKIHYEGLVGNCRILMEKQEKQLAQAKVEIQELEEWKASSLQVESTWDRQAVGREIDVPLGQDIVSHILPWILNAKAEIERLRYENQNWCCGCGHWNGANLAHCADCGRKPNEQ